jgi:hypothetical protein
VPVSDLIGGLAVLLVTLAACGAAGGRAARALVPDAVGAPRALAFTLTGSAAVLAAVIVPGALGLLRPLGMLGTAIALALLVRARVAAPARQRRERERPRRHEPLRSWLLPGTAALLVAACALALLRDLAGAPISSIDALNFQVPIPARWIQEHDVWGLHQFIPDYSNATYPHHGNALIAAVMLPFDSTFLARLVAMPYWAMAAVAVYAIARELGAPRPGAVAAAAAFAALPVSLRAGLDGAQTDMPMLAWLGAGVLFLLRHHRTGGRGDLVLAGLGLGLAFGTKWYALPTVGVVIALWAVARRRDVVRPGAALVGLIVVAGGFWLVRNWVRTGNPLFPQPLPPLFDAPEDPLREAGGFTIAHYLTDGGVWRDHLWPALEASFGLGGAALAAGVLVGARRAPLLAAGALALLAVYVVTPYSAFGPEGAPVLASASTRYALPALMACAVVAARVRWAAPLLAIGALDGLRRALDLPAGKVVLGIAAALVLAGAVRILASRPRLALAATAVALAILAAVARERANTQSYAPLDPTLAYVERRAPSGHEVGLAGIWSPDGVSPVLPAFGPRLGNRVAYVGEFRDGMLRAFTREEEFAGAARRFDLIVIGRGAPPRPHVREQDWAARAGFSEVAASPRLLLLVRGVQSGP